MDGAAAGASFEERFSELFELAMRPAWRLLSDRQEAENVAAEVLARALVRWRSLASSPTLPGWVVTVSTNLAIQHLRKSSRTAVRQVSVTQEAHSVDARLDLNDALHTLPRRQRETIELRYFLDFTEADIAGALGISVSSVKTHLHRGLHGLRRRLEDSEDSEEAAVGME